MEKSVTAVRVGLAGFICIKIYFWRKYDFDRTCECTRWYQIKKLTFVSTNFYHNLKRNNIYPLVFPSCFDSWQTFFEKLIFIRKKFNARISYYSTIDVRIDKCLWNYRAFYLLFSFYATQFNKILVFVRYKTGMRNALEKNHQFVVQN